MIHTARKTGDLIITPATGEDGPALEVVAQLMQ